MKKALIYWLDSGLNLHPSVNTWLAQGLSDGGTRPNNTVLQALSTFMRSLDAAGLGTSTSRMKSMNILHTGSKQFCLLNIKNPSTYKYTESGTVTFSEGNGCRSASNSYFNQPFKSDEYVGIQSNVTFIQYVSESSTASSVSKVSHGFRISASALFAALTPLSTASTGSSNHYDAGVAFTNNNHRALYIHTRAATLNITYKDGVKTTGSVVTNTPSISVNRFVLAFNNATTSNGTTPSSYYPHYVSIDAIYDAFTDADELAFRTAFNTYKTAVGLP